jgi:SAM-dependent methyltransferase
MSADYTTVTETWGLPASPEQLSMQYFRYRMAADLSKDRNVLEIGCGSGMGIPYLAERAGVVVGGDYTMSLLREARAQLPTSDLVRMDAQHLPFIERSFDVVVMLEMLYYVGDQEAAFAECARVLKPKGSLMVCAPNPERPDFNPSPFSTRYPNAAELAALFNRHGFEARLYGGFPIEAQSSRDRVLAPVRHFAVRHRLIPSSMRAKALVKRVLYGRLPTLGAVHDGMGSYAEPVELEASRPAHVGFKNLYAVGALR